MPRKPPETDAEFASLVDATLADVPLSAEEIAAARQELGMNTKRLGARIGQLLERVEHEQRATLARAAESMRSEQTIALNRLTPRRLTRDEARNRLRALESMPGAHTPIEGSKLDELSDDDLNHIVDELEGLFGDGSSEKK